jgi:hypothetical protein
MKTLPLFLILAALGAPAGAQPRPLFVLAAASLTESEATEAAAGAAKKDDLYRSAQRDLDASRWSQAIEKFGQMAAKKGPNADGALYWKAYAENKAGRSQQALATLRLLLRDFPKSSWLDDAKALTAEIRGTTSPSPANGGSDGAADIIGENEELKLYALNGLLASQPDRALPVLQKFLQGNHSQRLKEQALFVLSQTAAPEAHATLLATARGATHPELQEKAIEYLGIAGGEENVKALDEIYRGASRPEVKRTVLNAYLVSGARAKVLAVAQDGKDPLQVQAISTLGAMGAKEDLRHLYESAGSREARAQALDGLAIAGDSDTLIGIAKREPDPALRNKAIQGLGIRGGAKAGEALRTLYAGATDPSARRAVIDALFISSNAHTLIEIFRGEKDREMRREIVQRLSLMRSDEASAFLEKVYSN